MSLYIYRAIEFTIYHYWRTNWTMVTLFNRPAGKSLALSTTRYSPEYSVQQHVNSIALVTTDQYIDVYIIIKLYCFFRTVRRYLHSMYRPLFKEFTRCV